MGEEEKEQGRELVAACSMQKSLAELCVLVFQTISCS